MWLLPYFAKGEVKWDQNIFEPENLISDPLGNVTAKIGMSSEFQLQSLKCCRPGHVSVLAYRIEHLPGFALARFFQRIAQANEGINFIRQMSVTAQSLGLFKWARLKHVRLNNISHADRRLS